MLRLSFPKMYNMSKFCWFWKLTSNDLSQPQMTSDLKNSNRSCLQSVSAFKKCITCLGCTSWTSCTSVFSDFSLFSSIFTFFYFCVFIFVTNTRICPLVTFTLYKSHQYLNWFWGMQVQISSIYSHLWSLYSSHYCAPSVFSCRATLFIDNPVCPSVRLSVHLSQISVPDFLNEALQLLLDLGLLRTWAVHTFYGLVNIFG